MMAMRFDIITIFPDFFRGPLDYGILRRAQGSGLISVHTRDLREFTHDRHKTVDDRPFGGGEGMVLKPEPLFECVESLQYRPKQERPDPETVLLLSAQGRRFDQAMAVELAGKQRVAIICGRYEGVDERVAEGLADREVSVGDFVLSGGEIGAALIIDAVARLIPGALGNDASAQQESFTRPERAAGKEAGIAEAPDSTCSSGGLLDYPHYTRPAEFRGMKVPDVLSSGDHAQIRRWRRRKALEKTVRNRPDLIDLIELSAEDMRLIEQIGEEQQS
jgi:tRNA (guanine37-N1)-methyltransferase